MSKFPSRLTSAGITPARYDELRAFCHQYRDYKRALALSRMGAEDRPDRRSSGAWHKPDPTGNAAIALADSMAARRIRQIDLCLSRVAEPVVARALLLYVADGKAYEYQRPTPPICRNKFYVLAQLFYIELDRVLTSG